ncbi:hypothetical protein RRG08_055079 [Elysia crispata]|uniref:Uncharacterized protein n=1 Tax=Elysia crispata TaxID=231223 RepID=A0AAE1E8R0_9GAST|nr:hypothetical protein RRG08_055079 [Elysia crispata]
MSRDAADGHNAGRPPAQGKMAEFTTISPDEYPYLGLEVALFSASLATSSASEPKNGISGVENDTAKPTSQDVDSPDGKSVKMFSIMPEQML